MGSTASLAGGTNAVQNRNTAGAHATATFPQGIGKASGNVSGLPSNAVESIPLSATPKEADTAPPQIPAAVIPRPNGDLPKTSQVIPLSATPKGAAGGDGSWSPAAYQAASQSQSAQVSEAGFPVGTGPTGGTATAPAPQRAEEVPAGDSPSFRPKRAKLGPGTQGSDVPSTGSGPNQATPSQQPGGTRQGDRRSAAVPAGGVAATTPQLSEAVVQTIRNFKLPGSTGASFAASGDPAQGLPGGGLPSLPIIRGLPAGGLPLFPSDASSGVLPAAASSFQAMPGGLFPSQLQATSSQAQPQGAASRGEHSGTPSQEQASTASSQPRTSGTRPQEEASATSSQQEAPGAAAQLVPREGSLPAASASSSLAVPVQAALPASASSSSALPVQATQAALPASASASSALPVQATQVLLPASASSALSAGGSSQALPEQLPLASASSSVSQPAEVSPGALPAALPVAESSGSVPAATSSSSLPVEASSGSAPATTSSTSVTGVTSSGSVPAATSSSSLPVEATSGSVPSDNSLPLRTEASPGLLLTSTSSSTSGASSQPVPVATYQALPASLDQSQAATSSAVSVPADSSQAQPVTLSPGLPSQSSGAIGAGGQGLLPVQAVEGASAGGQGMLPADAAAGTEMGAQGLLPAQSAAGTEMGPQGLLPAQSVAGTDAGAQGLLPAQSVTETAAAGQPSIVAQPGNPGQVGPGASTVAGGLRSFVEISDGSLLPQLLTLQRGTPPGRARTSGSGSLMRTTAKAGPVEGSEGQIEAVPAASPQLGSSLSRGQLALAVDRMAQAQTRLANNIVTGEVLLKQAEQNAKSRPIASEAGKEQQLAQKVNYNSNLLKVVQAALLQLQKPGP
eukprot:jgi/Botrbrau1/16345/Bobra.0227s0002.1